MDTLHIDGLGRAGDGLASGPDGPVFVARALPGETVEGEIVAGRMDAPRILTPSPERVSPPCPHAKSCGGCVMQHGSDALVAEWKCGIVTAALEAQGLSADIDALHTSPPRTRRRAVFSATRTKKGALAGFHRRASNVIVQVPDCHDVHPDIAAALPLVEAIAILGASRKAEMSVTVTRTETGLDVAARGGKPADAATQNALADLARHHDLARLSWNDEVSLQRRAPVVRFGAAQVVPAPGAFLQATPHGEAALVAAVDAITGSAGHIVDLFAGCGTFTLPLAQKARVHAVEAEAAMLEALDHGWRFADGLRKVTTETRDLFRNPLLAEEFRKVDAVVIDPPRAGAGAQVAQLAQARVPVIAHVSCNPGSFARDCATLVRAGYRLGPVTVVDQFRWSPHVEIAAPLYLD